MIKIKICGMRNPQNVEEVSALHPDYLGYIFYPGSKRYVGDHPDMRMFINAGAGILKTGVFVNEPLLKIKVIGQKFGLSMLQLHGTESPEDCAALKATGFGIIKAFGIHSGFDFGLILPYEPVCDYFLFDTITGNHGGSGELFDWNILSQYRQDKPFFLSGGIGPDAAAAIKAFRHKSFYGLDLNSRFEDEPGIKNAGLLKTFINAIKS
jgi:phosphoribosylanthranilate isomerase